MSEPLQAIVAKTQTAVENAKAANRALDKRKISGRCYRAIGTSKRDLRNASRIATTADGFDKALQAGDAGRIKRASQDFWDALDTFSSGPSANAIKLLRSCPKP